MNSILRYIVPAILTTFLLTACKKLPRYDEKPEIEFSGFEIYRNQFSSLGLVYGDSVIVKLKFKDGDGDLGIDAEDKKSDSIPNFVMKTFVKNNTPFLDSLTYEGQFQPLTLSAKEIKGPIEGELRYAVLFSYSEYSPKDTLKFSIYIKDRADHVSNSIMTDILIVNNN